MLRVRFINQAAPTAWPTQPHVLMALLALLLGKKGQAIQQQFPGDMPTRLYPFYVIDGAVDELIVKAVICIVLGCVCTGCAWLPLWAAVLLLGYASHFGLQAFKQAKQSLGQVAMILEDMEVREGDWTSHTCREALDLSMAVSNHPQAICHYCLQLRPHASQNKLLVLYFEWRIR